jgi:hypothetical protein
VPPLLWPMLSRHRTTSHFLLIEPKWARYLCFIFSQRLSHRLPSQAETEALNPHRHRRLPSPDRLTPTLHCYKKIISSLATLPTTQLHLYFASFLARALCHQSSTRCCHSLSPLSYTHLPSTQRHPQWRTSRPSFTSRITYRHANSHKKIFWNGAASCRVIN